jgi:hypothetical protein
MSEFKKNPLLGEEDCDGYFLFNLNGGSASRPSPFH